MWFMSDAPDGNCICLYLHAQSFVEPVGIYIHACFFYTASHCTMPTMFVGKALLRQQLRRLSWLPPHHLQSQSINPHAVLCDLDVPQRPLRLLGMLPNRPQTQPPLSGKARQPLLWQIPGSSSQSHNKAQMQQQVPSVKGMAAMLTTQQVWLTSLLSCLPS